MASAKKSRSLHPHLRKRGTASYRRLGLANSRTSRQGTRALSTRPHPRELRYLTAASEKGGGGKAGSEVNISEEKPALAEVLSLTWQMQW